MRIKSATGGWLDRRPVSEIVVAHMTFTDRETFEALRRAWMNDIQMEVRLKLKGVDEPQVLLPGFLAVKPLGFGYELELHGGTGGVGF